MLYRISFVVICSILFMAEAQQINLTGTVTSISGNPIKNATVTIVGKNISDTTDQNGYFEINSELSVENHFLTETNSFLQICNSMLCLTLKKNDKVTLELISLKGQLISRLLLGTYLQRGTYYYNLGDISSKQCIILHLNINGIEQYRKVFMNSSIRNKSKVSPEILLNKQAVTYIDTLLVKADGYDPKKLGITGYISSYNITLNPITFKIVENDLAFWSSENSISVGEKKKYYLTDNHGTYVKGVIVKWNSSDTSIISIDKDSGNALCKNFGKASITVQVYDSSNHLLGSDTLSYIVEWGLVKDFINDRSVELSRDYLDGTLYCTYACSVFRSDDNGTTWKQIKTFDNNTPCYDNSKIKISPVNHNVIGFLQYAGVGGDRTAYLYLSQDKGQNWTQSTVYLDDFEFNSRDPFSFYAIGAGFFAKNGSDSPLVKISELGSGFGAHLYLDMTDTNIIYEGISSVSYISKNSGKDWSRIHWRDTSYNNIPDMEIIHISSDGTIYGLDFTYWVNLRLILSRDKGTTWKVITDKFSDNVSDISSLKNMVGYTCSEYIYLSQDSCKTWKQMALYCRHSMPANIGSFLIANVSPLEFLVSDGSWLWKYRKFVQ